MAFRAQARRIQQATERGLYRTGNAIITTAVELVPVETGTLRASARVNPPVSTGGGRIEVRAGFGYGSLSNPLTGADPASYGPYVEARTDVSHPHGQAHFLRDAALAHIRELAPNIRAELHRGAFYGVQVLAEGGE